MFTVEELIAMGISEEHANAVIAEQTRIISEGTGQWIPQHRLNQAIQERDTAREQVAERDTQIADLRTFEGTATELAARVTELEAENAQQAEVHDAELLGVMQTQAIRNWFEASEEYKPQNVDILLGLVTREDIVFGKDTDGKLTVIQSGLEEQVKPILEKEPYLFVPKESTPPADPSKNAMFRILGKKPEDGTSPKETSAVDYGKQMAATKNAQMGIKPKGDTQ